MALKGIDVSKYQGMIDWEKVKSNIDFAILRCGFGSDIAKQDDAKFERNASECERLGIPYGVYIYSYATNSQKITSEISHTLRVVGKRKPFCIYIDMEDASTARLGKRILTAFACQFCEGIKSHGFNVGVYANQNWFQNYLNVAELFAKGYSIWCAKYSSSAPSIDAKYDIWQYSSKGLVPGIVGNVDMNYMYKDIRNVQSTRTAQTAQKPATSKKLSTSQLTDAILAGKYGNGDARIANLKKAGYTDAEIKAAQTEVNNRVKKTSTKTSSTKLSAKELAKKILRGDYGNGAARMKRLKSLGYTEAEIKTAQNLVNKGEVK